MGVTGSAADLVICSCLGSIWVRLYRGCAYSASSIVSFDVISFPFFSLPYLNSPPHMAPASCGVQRPSAAAQLTSSSTLAAGHTCVGPFTSPSCCHSLASFHRSHSVTIAFSSWSCLHLHAFLCLRFRCIAHSSFSFALSSNPLLLLHARLGTRAFNPNFKCGFFC